MENTPPTDFVYNPPLEPYLTIIYQDDDILVLDKPSGLLHVSGKHPSLWDCLEFRVKKQFPRASVIHRIDKDTSGVVVMALNKKAHAAVATQFEKRLTQKSYIARVWGQMDGDNGHVDLPIGSDWDRRPRMRIDPEHGRPAQTDWTVLEREENATRIRLIPRTGRTHQLRVHMLHLGHPILGDTFYAEGPALTAADRLQLHAEELTFRHPVTGEMQTFTVPCPF